MDQHSADARDSVEAVAHRVEDDHRWDATVLSLQGATTLHTRNFLNYHNDRFADRSFSLVDPKSGQVLALMPAAQHPQDSRVVVSHPGSSFGGLLLRKLDPEYYARLFAIAKAHLRGLGYETLRSKTTPTFVGDVWNEVPTHYGLRFGKLVRADLWNAIRLDTDFKFASTRKSDIKAAVRKGVSTRRAAGDVDWNAFHQLLQTNLRDRHGTVPVHSFGELVDLRDRLGPLSRLLLCHDTDNQLVAGTWLLDYGNRVLHTQYICSNDAGRSLHAVDVLLGDAIAMAKSEGYRVFSFGINTQPDGWTINTDLMKYKLRFGSGVVLHPTFDFDLRSENAAS